MARTEAPTNWAGNVTLSGKVFGIDPAAVRAQLSRLPDAERLYRATDPTGKFRNSMIDRYLPGQVTR